MWGQWGSVRPHPVPTAVPTDCCNPAMSWEALVGIATVIGVVLAAIQVWQGRRAAWVDVDSDAASATASGTQPLFQNAAVALTAMAAVLDSIRLGLTQYGQSFFDAERPRAAFQDLETEGAELDKLLSRLKVAPGVPPAASAAFEEAAEATLEIYRALCSVRRERPEHESLDLYARAQVRKYFEEDVARITRAREEFDAARASFEGAASPG